MGRLLRAFGLIVLILAAIDTALARDSVPHRAVEAGLFLESLLLWGVFALIALVPAYLTVRGIERRIRGATDDGLSTRASGCVLLFWTALPVVLHAALDAFTGEGQDISKLKQVGPWLVVLGVGAAYAGMCFGLAKLLARAPTKPILAAAGGLALIVGFFLPRSLTPPPVEGAKDATGKPNLLLLVWDTCRADHTGPYGYSRDTTPHLAKLAEESLVLEEARSATIFTFTSHLTMLTGVMPSVHGARLLRTLYDPRKATTVAEILRNEGYRTGGFVGTDVLAGRTGMRHGFEVYADRVDPGVCDTYAWKFIHDVQSVLALKFRAFRNNGRPHWIQDFQRPAEDVLDEALAWIDNGDERPWFCMINLYDVHWPYVPGDEARDVMVREYNGAFDGFLFRSDNYEKGTKPGPEDAQHLRDLYDAELLELDRKVHDFLEALDLDRTGLIVTSDHGEAFGEANTWKHENLYEPQLTIPFIVRVPGGEKSGRVATRAAGIDVAPTLLGMAGVEIPEIVQGVDLTRVVPDPERVLMVEDSDHIDPTFVRLALYRGRWKIVRRGKPEAFHYTLHDLSKDPVAEHDVSAAHPDIKAELVAKMVEIRGDADLRMSEEEYDLGAARDGLEALGYLDGDD